MSGNAEIRFNCRSGATSEQFHFVFRPIPDGKTDNKFAGAKEIKVVVLDAGGTDSDGGKDAVFIGVAEFVQSPDRIVPSFVWLEPAKQVSNLLRDFFPYSIHHTIKFGKAIGDREVAEVSNESKHGLVESGSQITNGVKRDAFQSGWHGLNELELVNILGAIRIRLTDTFVGCSFEKLRDLPFEITDVMLCSRNAEL